MNSNESMESPQLPKRKIRLNLKGISAIQIRLNRIEGQVRGVQRLVERNDYCDHVLTQIAAIHNALNGVGTLLLLNHLKCCIIHRTQQSDEEKNVVDEMLEIMSKLIK